MGIGCRQTLWTVVGVIAVLWFMAECVTFFSLTTSATTQGNSTLLAGVMINLAISGGIALVCNSLLRGTRAEIARNTAVASATVQNVIYVQAPVMPQPGSNAVPPVPQQIEDPFAPQLPAPDTQKILGVASGLIKSGQYDKARMMLQTISNNAKAQEWLRH